MLTWLALAVLAAGGVHWLAGAGRRCRRRLPALRSDGMALGAIALLVWVLASPRRSPPPSGTASASSR